MSKRDYSLFSKEKDQHFVTLVVYVDDVMIIMRTDSQGITQLKQDLDKTFTIKDIGNLRYFLGIKLSRSSYETFLHQRK